MANKPNRRTTPARPRPICSERLLQQAKALRHYQQAHAALRQAKQSAKSGDFTAAEKASKRFRSEWALFQKLDTSGKAGSLPSSPDTHKALFASWSRWSASLGTLQKVHAMARFRRANQLRQTLSKELSSIKAYSTIRRRFSRQRKLETRAWKAYLGAQRAYRKKRWKRARLLYRLYLRLFPRAWNRRVMRKRLKACRCMLKVRPWEICLPADYPLSVQKKRGQ
jgi:hypothetical protein